MYNDERHLSFRYDNITENKEELVEKLHLTDVELNKLRNVIKTKVAGELMISEEYYSDSKISRVYQP
jgi:hypothetical protein